MISGKKGEHMVDWQKLINSYSNDVDKYGKGPPDIEMVKEFAEEEESDEEIPDDGIFFVQKVITEVYIYTNRQGQTFGDHTFQDMVILGEMKKDKLEKLLERQREKRNKQKGTS